MEQTSNSNHRTNGISRHLKVILHPTSCNKLRISDELARHLDGGGGTALVVSPFGSKIWRVVVGRDSGGAFLGRGWPEFVAAHGIGALWFVVFRHEGGGLLTVKAFDNKCCLQELGRPINVAANQIGSRRPQFIQVLLRGFTEKMVIPPEFVRKHITDTGSNSRLAAFLNLCGKYWRVEVQKDGSGNMFFSGGWSRFLASNGINEGEALLLRCEGNMVFTVKVFGLNGCQKSFENQQKYIRLENSEQTEMKMEMDAPSSCPTGKCKSRNEGPSVAGEMKRPVSFSAPSNKGSASFCTYDVGPPSWIKKEINAYALEHHLPLTPAFCKAIGFLQTCEITLRTSLTGTANRSWQVRGCAYSRSSQYQLTGGWKSFCRDNGLVEGDVCTFNIIHTTLWHVDIARRS